MLAPRKTILAPEATPYSYPTHLPGHVKAQHDPICASEVVRHYTPVRLTPAGVPLFATNGMVSRGQQVEAGSKAQKGVRLRAYRAGGFPFIFPLGFLLSAWECM